MTNPFTDYGTQKWQKGMCAVCWRERGICAAKTPHAQLSPCSALYSREHVLCFLGSHIQLYVASHLQLWWCTCLNCLTSQIHLLFT